MIMRWIAWGTIGVSLLLYVLACALPSGVVVGIDPEDEVRGIWCLVGGWTAVFFPKEALLKYPLMTIFNAFVSLFLWGSNILYFWAIIDTLRAKVRKRTVWLTILAFSASLCYFLISNLSSRISAFRQLSLGSKLSGNANRSRDSLVEQL